MHAPLDDPASTRAAGTVAASVRKANPGTETRRKDRFIVADVEAVTARLDRYGEWHTGSMTLPLIDPDQGLDSRVPGSTGADADTGTDGGGASGAPGTAADAGSPVGRPRTGRGGHLARPRILVVGCGDVGLRVVALLAARFRIFAVTHSPERVDALRRAGTVPIVADLDRSASVRRLAGLARWVIHLAPPPPHGDVDRRTRRLLAALSRRRASRLRQHERGSTATAAAPGSTRRSRWRPPPRGPGDGSMPNASCAAGRSPVGHAFRSCACRASTRATGCRSTDSRAARRHSSRPKTRSRTMSMPTISRASSSRRYGAARHSAPITRSTTAR